MDQLAPHYDVALCNVGAVGEEKMSAVTGGLRIPGM
jgi:hypothetical protein